MKKYLVLLVLAAAMFSFAFAVNAQPSAVNSMDWNAILAEADTNAIEQPDAPVTRAELDAVLMRLSELYDGAEPSTEAGADETPVTRFETVKALYDVVIGVDSVDKTAKNTVNDIFDVESDNPYYASAKAFLEWGIVYGTNEYAAFGGERIVTRYELSLMIDRILNANERVSAVYELYQVLDPFYLIDDNNLTMGANGVNDGGSGWRIDYTGSYEKGTKGTYNDSLDDYASTDCMSMSRYIQTQDKGTLVFEAVYKVISADDLEFQFLDDDGRVVAKFGWLGNKAYIGENVTSRTVNDVADDLDAVNVTVRTKAVIDLDSARAELYLGDTYIAGTAIEAGSNIAKVNIVTASSLNDTPMSAKGRFDFDQFYLYKNYYVNDAFRTVKPGAVPSDYTVSTGTATVEKINSVDYNTGDVYSLLIGANSVVRREFDFTVDKAAYTAYFIAHEGVKVSLMSGDGVIMAVEAKSDGLYYGDVKLCTYTDGVWQQVRFELDSANSKAVIKINGKTIKDGNGIDREFTIAKSKGASGFQFETGAKETYVDDIRAWVLYEYTDYVPEPVKLDTGDYVLSMSSCNLWRNGNHYGWEWIDGYGDEYKPITGYYDEGSPEEMDWEIKFLTEHGISNYALCWYPNMAKDTTAENANAALKTPRIMGEMLHEGFFNAKYSDLMTFNLMFENSNYGSKSGNATNASAINAAALKDFKENVFPMWIDWYFKDDRYLTIDGKAVITVYSFAEWLNMAGDNLIRTDSGSSHSYTYTSGAPKSKELLAWMNQQVAAANIPGVTGVMLNFGGAFEVDSAYAAMAAAGGENIILYAWGKERNIASDLNEQKNFATTYQSNVNKQTSSATNAKMNLVALPAASFNDLPWTTERTPVMSPSDFQTLVGWYKNTYMENSKNTGSMQNFIQFDTWNEYGEGHYLYPTEKDGYAYLDAIANVFASGHDSSRDIMPTDEQKARITNLYQRNGYHKIVRLHNKPDYEPPITRHVEVDYTGGGDGQGNSVFAPSSEYNNNTEYFKNLTTGISALWSKKYAAYDSSYGGATYCQTKLDNAKIYISSNYVDQDMPMSDYDFLLIKYGIVETAEVVQNGAGTGKLYFIAHKDGTYQQEFTDAQSISFEAPVGAEGSDVIVDLTQNAAWQALAADGWYLSAIQFEPTNYKDRTVYIYNISLCEGDPSTGRTEIVIDGHEYVLSHYGEILAESRQEIYIAPAHGGGLYQILHIVYDWDGTTLTLEGPYGGKMQFTVGSNKVHITSSNGTVRIEDLPVAEYAGGLGEHSGKYEQYDGVPIIPLFYVLNTFEIDYAHDHDLKKLEIFVSDYINHTTDIIGGSAESTIDTQILPDGDVGGSIINTSFYDYYTTRKKISIVQDPTNKSNNVFFVDGNSTEGEITEIYTLIKYERGKTYTMHFDFYIDGYGPELIAPTEDIHVRYQIRYEGNTDFSPSQGDKQLYKGGLNVKTWYHTSVTFTITEPYSEDQKIQQQFVLTFLAQNGLSPRVYFDDFVLLKEETNVPVTNGDAEDLSQPNAFFNDTSNVDYIDVSIVEDPDDAGNHYWAATPTVDAKKWAYITQNIEFEPGATYYYRLKVKVGKDSTGADVSDWKINYNFRYYDALLHRQGHGECAHNGNLRDRIGNVLTFSTGDDWAYAFGSITIGLDYEPSKCKSEIAFYVDPNGDHTVGFMIDDVVFSTKPLSVVD